MVTNNLRAYSYNEPAVEPDFEKEFKVLKGKEKVTTTKVYPKAKPVSKLSLVLTTLSIFAMLFVISYRYNVISEKNLKLQRLNIEEVTTNAALLDTEVRVNQNIDMNYVESYAKQQLGMQKPEKSQVIYITTSTEAKVEEMDNGNIIKVAVDKIKTIINDILK